MKKPKTAKKEKMSKCLPAEALAKAGGIRGGLKRIKDVPIFCPHFPIFSGAKHREDKMIKKLLFAFLCFMISGGLKLQGAGPGKINYQGRLRESGQPVSGTKSINFKIYDAATVGELKWESTAQAITVSTGIFNYQMTPTGIDWSTGQYWLEIVVGGTSLSPREQLLASAYSLYSDDSDKLDGRQYTAYVSTYNEAQTIGGVKTFTLNVFVEGNVGIGTTSPGAKLDVRGGSVTVRGLDSQRDILGLGSASGDYKVVVSTSGNVGIGTTGPTHLIQLAGGAYCDGTGDWIAGSDRSYKKDINYDFKYGLNEVEQLKPVHYVHKQDKDNKKQVGFIAQDILNVLPEVVSGTEGSYGVSYGQITAVLVKAIQEQQNQIKELKDEIEKIRRSQ